MFIPASFRVDDPARIAAFIGEHSFATLATRDSAGELTASHVPLLLVPGAEPAQLEGHLARANPQWRDVAGEALAIFSGPHAYVSPRWYEESGVVPTWNYVAVHAYGRFEIVGDDEQTRAILRRSLEKYEHGRPRPWTLEDSGAGVEKLLAAIVAFRITLTRVEGKWKLNQNHTRDRQARVAAALSAEGGEDNAAIAGLMRANVDRAD